MDGSKLYLIFVKEVIFFYQKVIGLVLKDVLNEKYLTG